MSTWGLCAHPASDSASRRLVPKRLARIICLALAVQRIGQGIAGQMDDTVEAIQTGIVNFTGVRIPPDFAWAGCMPDQANDFVTTFNQVAGHG